MNIESLHTKTIEDRNQFSFIVSSLKRIVGKYDSNAIITLFGSRARGDYHEESDWDFLILTSYSETNYASNESIRKEILYEIEFKVQQHIATIFHNRYVWQSDYSVTNLYRSIQEEGVVV